MDENRYRIDQSKQKILKAFQETTLDGSRTISNFLLLQNSLLKWAKKHNLDKDWIVEYAYSFLDQFCETPDIKIKDLKVELKDILSLQAPTFEFTARGWQAGEEKPEEYQEHITKLLREELSKYFDSAHRTLNLSNQKITTNPIDYERVKWLVRWTVQEWSKDDILSEIYDETGKSSDESRINHAFSTFREHNLPVRN